MRRCVLDCSFFVSSLLPDEGGVDFDFSAYDIFVPSIFFLECSNALLVAVRKGRLSASNYEQCIKEIYELPFKVDNFCSCSHSVFTISHLARKHNLTSYDASYVELALRLRVCLGSLDKKVIAACNFLNIGSLINDGKN